MVSKASVLFALSFFAPPGAAFAQTHPGPSPLPSAPQTLKRQISWKQLLPNVLKDQKEIWWEFPNDLARGEHWLPTSLTLAGTAGLIALDPHIEPYFRRTTAFHGFNRVMSFNGTIAAMAAVPATTYFVGLPRNSPAEGVCYAAFQGTPRLKEFVTQPWVRSERVGSPAV